MDLKPNNQKKNVTKTARNPPVIKHNKASMYRLFKANPLLKHGMANPTASSTANSECVKTLSKMNSLDTLPLLNGLKKPSTSSKQIAIPTKPPNSTVSRTHSLKEKTAAGTRTKFAINQPQVKIATQSKAEINKPLNHQTIIGQVRETSRPKERVEKKIPIRRSLSAQHFEKKKTVTIPLRDDSKTQSVTDVSKADFAKPFAPQEKVLSNGEALDCKKVTFKTPEAYKRRSVAFFTPDESTLKRRSQYTPYCSTPGPAADDLQKRLTDWVKKHGKSTSIFRHLKCFGVKDNVVEEKEDEENKENVDTNVDVTKEIYEDFRIVADDELPKTATTESDLQEIAKDALHDLHKLILEGYPKEQCEAWLGIIRRKYKKLEEEPQYWECLAALEELRGNITTAVEYYRTAIVQGAEVSQVDESLENLLQKFSLLNISTNTSDLENENTKPDRKRIILDARNAFKSSIIQFAIQERTLKKNKNQGNEDLKIVTPVRRSTRLSRTGYVKTPNTSLISSFSEMDSTLKANIEFRNNSCLAVKFQK